jgi:hypothetical protein
MIDQPGQRFLPIGDTVQPPTSRVRAFAVALDTLAYATEPGAFRVANNVAVLAASLVEWVHFLKDTVPECEAVIRSFAANDLTVVRDEAPARIRGSRPTQPCSTSRSARNAPAATRPQPRPILVTAAADKTQRGQVQTTLDGRALWRYDLG